VSLESLLQWPWVTSALPSRLGKLLPGDLGRAGRRDATSGRFLPAIEIEMMKGIGRVARESDALAATTLTLVEQELEGGELKVVPFAAPWFRLNAGFITLEGRTLAPAVAPFVSIVRQIAAELAEREEQLRARFASFPTLR
jgi:DNA-binding transcriptional LysR family regulator